MVSSSIQAFTFRLFLPSVWNSGFIMVTRSLAIIKLGVRRCKKGKKLKKWFPKDESVFFKQFFSDVLHYPWTQSNVHSWIDVGRNVLIKKSSVLFAKEEGESAGFGKQWVVPDIVGMQASYRSIRLLKLLSIYVYMVGVYRINSSNLACIS